MRLMIETNFSLWERERGGKSSDKLSQINFFSCTQKKSQYYVSVIINNVDEDGDCILSDV